MGTIMQTHHTEAMTTSSTQCQALSVQAVMLIETLAMTGFAPWFS